MIVAFLVAVGAAETGREALMFDLGDTARIPVRNRAETGGRDDRLRDGLVEST